MSVAASRIVGPIQAANADALVYTSTSAVTKVRHIRVANPTGGAVTFTMSVGTDTAANRIYDAVSIPAGSAIETFCYYVLASGETLRAHASAATSLVIIVDADVVTLG